jgi:hypothetical protein
MCTYSYSENHWLENGAAADAMDGGGGARVARGEVAIERIDAWDGFVPEWMGNGGEVWLSNKNLLYRAASRGAPPRPAGRVALNAVETAASFSAHMRRLLRLAYYNVVPRPDGTVFATFGKQLVVLGMDGSATLVQGLQKPFRVLRGGCAMTPNGDIFFGEYFANMQRDQPVNVYRLPHGGKRAEIVKVFAVGEIRHVHSVRYDPFREALWLCAGDWPRECRILRTTDGFGSVESVGAGDETWRAIQPIFLARGVFYATDAEFDPNAIYRLDRASGGRDRIASTDGPSYYGGQIGDAVLFATTAELCPSQQERESVLWAVVNGDASPVARWRKDLFGFKPMVPLFQPGHVLFPSGAVADYIPFTGLGLLGLDGQMFAARLV